MSSRRPVPVPGSEPPEVERGSTSEIHTGTLGLSVTERVEKSENEWKELLSEEEYRILREKGTEPAFTGEYWDEKAEGVYKCRACGTPLFASDTKYDSGTGWPSFYAPVSEDNVREEKDRSLLMTRTEALCAACGGHLGHVFPDGPEPTGVRYCINSAALDLEPAEGEG